MRLAVLALASAMAAPAGDVLVFSFFRNNGEDGLYLAQSRDGLTWTPLNGGLPLLKPEVGESKLMRDPSIARGPDGMFHMVWTTSWQGRTIGYSRSKDLRNWSPQRAIPILPDEPGLLNCWAPEVFYDETARNFAVVWASTIKGRFPETLGKGNNEYNHRLYSFRTGDFETFSETRLFYDPGFQVIDGALFRVNGRWAMVAKNETLTPPANDKYTRKRYGGMRSQDLKSWEDITARVSFPPGARHGTVFRAPENIVKNLERKP